MTGILLIGGTGTVGRATHAALAAMGIAARVASRRPGAGGIAIDLTDSDSLATARGHATALLVTPIGPDETAIGLAAIAALRRAGVTKIVYLSIMNLEAMQAIPHFAAKLPLKQAVLSDGRSVVLEANFFQSNDRMLLPAILGDGIYALPVGSAGVWSVAPADLGAAAANALTRPDWNGKAVPLCGPERLTGPMLATNWADRLQKPVAYGGDDTAPFVAQVGAGIPPEAAAFRDWLRHDMQTMMEITQAQGCPATPDEVKSSEALIGRPANRHRDYIQTLGDER